MPNRYLLKIAELSHENKQVAKTFLTSWVPSIPLDLAGAAVGHKLGEGFKGFNLPKAGVLGKFSGHNVAGSAIGSAVGASLVSGAGELVGIKHSLKGKIKEPGNG